MVNYGSLIFLAEQVISSVFPDPFDHCDTKKSQMSDDHVPFPITVQTISKDPTGPMASIISPHTATSPAPATQNYGLFKVAQIENVDDPDHKYQVNGQLLYEREFHGHAYASAHLQRLQHGVFDDDMVHDKNTLHVTFVAVTFTFHPSLSISHRFESAIIEITARTENEPLRFVKFAPHLAYGRISSENLKWTFQLGATAGITKGPANLSVSGTKGYEKDKVLGTMMKIQGSTRSLNVSDRERRPDTKLVWSMEENDQQMTGLPREFTFVFLLARPAWSHTSRKSAASEHEKNGHVATSHTPMDPEAIFSPIRIGITIKPRISNIMTSLTTLEHSEETRIEGEFGQKLKAAVSNTGYYNFAKMPGSFEHLIELPGNAISSVVCFPYKIEQEDPVTDRILLGTYSPSLDFLTAVFLTEGGPC
jgi:hypothetical protein